MRIEATLLFAVVIVLLVTCVGLVSVSRNNKRAKWLAISMLAPMLWALFLGLFLSTNDPILGAPIVYSYYVFAAIAPLFYIFLAIIYIGGKIPPLLAIILSATTIAICLMSITPGLLIKDIDIMTHTAELSLLPYLIYTLYFVVFYSTSILIILKKYLTLSKNRHRRNQYLGIFLSCWTIGGILGATFDLFLPLFGNYSLIWVGPLGLVAFVPVAFRIATTNEHFSALKTFAVGLLYCTFTLFGAILGIITLYSLNKISETNTLNTLDQYFIGLAILLFLITATILLFKALGGLVDKLNSDGYDEKAVLSAMSQIIDGKHEPQEFLRSIRHTLKKLFAVDQVDIIIFGHNTAAHLKDTALKPVLLRLASNNRHHAIYSEDVRNKTDLMALKAYNIEVLAPIIGTIDNQVVGVITLSPRKRRFNRYYGETLERVSAIISSPIQSVAFYDQVLDYNEKLKLEVNKKTQKLRENNKELMKLDEMKSDLLSNASHNLRTPLTGVIGYADMLLDGSAGKITKEQRGYIEAIVQSGNTMAQVIADLLDATRIDSGNFVLRSEPLNLTELVEQEISPLKEIAASKGKNLVYNDSKKTITINGDSTRLKQAIINIVDNAIFYGNNTIAVSLHKVKDTIEFRVADDGIGIPKDDQSKIFNKMFRASNADTVRPDGTGIGLYVVKNIIESSGGEIIFESAEGEGSIFGFRLKQN